MDDCLPSERTCSLVSVIPPQTLLCTVHHKVVSELVPFADQGSRSVAKAGVATIYWDTITPTCSLLV